MLASPTKPIIHDVWFNDPNTTSKIKTFVGNVNFQSQELRSEEEEEHNDDSSLLTSGKRLTSVTQGRSFIDNVMLQALSVASPRGRGPARPDALSDHASGIFPNLLLEINGPTNANVISMRSNLDNSFAINRSSTIFTVRYRPNQGEFSAVFTGDAWDFLPMNNDIRGLLFPQRHHFKVMKVPHHGSKHSEDIAFYHNYTARYYLVSSRYNSHKCVPPCPMPLVLFLLHDRIPSFQIVEAMLEGCYLRGKQSPTIITTSWWTESKLGEKLAPMLETLLKNPNYGSAQVCVFNDQKN